MTPSSSPPDSFPSLYYALSTLRLVLPATLLSLLLVRWVSKSALAWMARIQAGGWTDEEDLFGPPERAPAVGKGKKDKGKGKRKGKDKKKAATGRADATEDEAEADDGEEDEVTPVVVKEKEMRQTLVLYLEGFTAATYFAEGIAQIVTILVTSVFTPSLPLYSNIIPYTVGGLAAFTICGLGMAYEAKLNAKSGGKWGQMYPRIVAVVALVGEVAVLSVLAKIVAVDPSINPQTSLLPSIHLSVLSLRLLLLLSLTLSQLPPFYRGIYLPNPELAAGERTSLLSGANGRQNGYAAIPQQQGKDEPSPLRATNPPPKRPDVDNQSLSILTLFARIKILFPYLWPAKHFALQAIAVFCFCLMLVKRYVNVIVPIFFGRVISDLSAGRPPYLNVGLYVLVSFLQDSSDMLYRWLWLPIEAFSEREMGLMAFDQVMSLSLSYHTKRRTGELLRILGRSEAINDFFQILLFQMVPILIDLPVAFAVLWVRYGATIVGVVAVVSVIYVSTSITLAQSRTKMYRELRDQGQYMHQIKTDCLFNWETTKASVSESFEQKRLSNAMKRQQMSYFKVYAAWNSLSLLQNAISGFGLLVTAFILAKRVVEGEMDVGSFATFTAYLSQLYRPLNSISSTYRQTMSSLVDTEQLMELLEEERDIVDREGAVELPITDEGGAGVSFRDVTFSYDGKVDVLKGISFEVPRGSTVALVGPSGGGKSTIMRLLYRFYDVKSGSIQINGVDLRDAKQKSIRKAIGLVPQEPVLFNETIRYNIAYGGISRLDSDGKTGLTMDDVVGAAQSAAMHDRIMSFPEQYETRVGERGMRLSGGEKQRVAIARVLLKDSPILLLDEATSALDTENERKIQLRLKELAIGRTTIAIAHRLSSVVDSDIIYVLNEGRIAESGNHAELLAKGGVYADLWAAQIDSQDSVLPSTSVSTRAPTPAPVSSGSGMSTPGRPTTPPPAAVPLHPTSLTLPETSTSTSAGLDAEAEPKSFAEVAAVAVAEGKANTGVSHTAAAAEDEATTTASTSTLPEPSTLEVEMEAAEHEEEHEMLTQEQTNEQASFAAVVAAASAPPGAAAPASTEETPVASTSTGANGSGGGGAGSGGSNKKKKKGKKGKK